MYSCQKKIDYRWLSIILLDTDPFTKKTIIRSVQMVFLYQVTSYNNWEIKL